MVRADVFGGAFVVLAVVALPSLVVAGGTITAAPFAAMTFSSIRSMFFGR